MSSPLLHAECPGGGASVLEDSGTRSCWREGTTIPQSARAARAQAGMSAVKATLTSTSALARERGVWPVVCAAGFVIGWGIVLRCSLAAGLAWQIDELPLMLRATAWTGKVATEAEAASFVPSLYGVRQGAYRSLRAPRHPQSLAPTAAFWANLTTYAFGMTPTAARVMPLVYSVAAMAMAGWLARLYGGGILASWTSASVLALSPLLIVYGAQTRGYAESAAWSGSLLVALAYLHRRPASIARLLIVWLVSQIAAITVITTWGYWVLPVLVAACLMPPRELSAGDRTALRRGLLLVVAGLLATMTVYVLDRWETFSLQMAQFGDGVRRAGGVVGFLAETASALLPWTAVVVLLAVPGLGVASSGARRWCVVVLCAGVAVPGLKLLLTGDVGYSRNFVYWLVPLAAWAGLGAEWLVARAGRLAPRRLLVSVTVLTLILGAAVSHGGIEKKARNLLHPDWAAALASLDQARAEAVPRWVCPCLTYHWLLTWYQSADPVRHVLRVPLGGLVEVVLTATVQADGREMVFAEDHTRGAIVEEELPGFLAVQSVWRVVEGVSVRRWSAVRVDASSLPAIPENVPVLVVLPSGCDPTPQEWAEFIRSRRATQGSMVSFKPVETSDGAVRSLLVRAGEAREMEGVAAQWGSRCAQETRWFVGPSRQP